MYYKSDYAGFINDFNLRINGAPLPTSRYDDINTSRAVKMRRKMKMKRKSKKFQVHTIGTIGTIVQSRVQNSCMTNIGYCSGLEISWWSPSEVLHI